MRILFYSNWYVKQTLQTANALAQEHQVALVLPEVSAELNAFNGRVAELRQHLASGVTLATLPHMQELDVWGFLPVFQARRLIRQFDPEVVHFNESYDFRCLLLMLACPERRYVLSVHDPIPHSGEEISLRRFKHWVRNQIRRRADGLIVYGVRLREVLAGYSNLPIERIYSVPHGEYRYYDYFDQGGSKTGEKEHKNVLFFGRWESYKGIDVLIDAEPLITERVPNARIVLAGEGRLQLSELQPRMVHPERFEIRNYAIPDAEVPDLFRAADVVVLPYRQATQSGPLHIAGTFGKPAVVTRVGALPEVIEEGVTGLLISPNSPQELAQAVCSLLENPEAAQRIGENAKQRMSQAESSEAVAQLQTEVYRQVIERARKPRRVSEPALDAAAKAAERELASSPRNRRTIAARRGFTLAFLQWIVKKVKRDPHYAFDATLRASDLATLLRKLAGGWLRGWRYRPFLRSTRGFFFIGKGVKLRNCGRITLGRNFVAEDGCEIQGLARSGVRFGDNVTVGAYAMIRPSGYYGREIGEGLEVGDHSNIGPYCYLGASGGISIGKEVLMGPRVSLFAENHKFERTDLSIRQQGVTRQCIVVEDGCWLASGSIILAGVTIGRDSIVAAGAVVTKDVPPYCIVAGNPARVIRQRGEREEAGDFVRSF